MIRSDSLFGSFILAVAHLRELQRTPLHQWSAAKAHELDRATEEVDSQVALFLTRSIAADEFGQVIDAMEGRNN
jgi:hypothetical protein